MCLSLIHYGKPKIGDIELKVLYVLTLNSFINTHVDCWGWTSMVTHIFRQILWVAQIQRLMYSTMSLL